MLSQQFTRNNKNIKEMSRDKNIFKSGCHPRNNLVKEQNRDLPADSHSTLSRRKKYFCHLLNIHGVNYVRQTEIDTAEPQEPA
jgi:hypothetical protein